MISRSGLCTHFFIVGNMCMRGPPGAMQRVYGSSAGPFCRMRSRTHGWYGRPPSTAAPMFPNCALMGRSPHTRLIPSQGRRFAARHIPDKSGMWRAANRLPCDGINRVCGDLPISAQFGNIGAAVEGGLPYQPWVRDRIRQKGPADDPYTRCIAPGGPRMHMLPTMKKWVQSPDLLIILDEYNASHRQIFLDGRPLPADPVPTWNGYATGHWEGDTLVVESSGYRDDQWLDAAGSAITSTARVTERMRRVNFGTLLIDLSVDDPKAYTRPWSVTLRQDVVVDTEMVEAICAENEKDVPHLNAAPRQAR